MLRARDVEQRIRDRRAVGIGRNQPLLARDRVLEVAQVVVGIADPVLGPVRERALRILGDEIPEPRDRALVVADLALALRRFVSPRFRCPRPGPGRCAVAAATAAGAAATAAPGCEARALWPPPRAARSASCACRGPRTCPAGAWRPSGCRCRRTSIWPRSCVSSWRNRSSCCASSSGGIGGRRQALERFSMLASRAARLRSGASAHRGASTARRSACARASSPPNSCACERNRQEHEGRRPGESQARSAKSLSAHASSVTPHPSRVTRHFVPVTLHSPW